jgi:hypothetical protein
MSNLKTRQLACTDKRPLTNNLKYFNRVGVYHIKSPRFSQPPAFLRENLIVQIILPPIKLRKDS